mgnify:CR=1 FL=1|tara:strand:+ start:239 stop:550 length:312 start_codon:yes stop_codon:yes gene_type:complete
MRLKPLGDRVVIKPRKQKEKTKSGLYLPDGDTKKESVGKVVAVGNGRFLKDGTTLPIDVQVGDKVLFSKYSGDEIKLDDEELLILSESDVLAVIKTDEDLEFK